MSKGVVLFAQNNQECDYVRQAYALACSILAQSPNTNISLITNDNIPVHYKNVFDKIIDIPWGDMSDGKEWKIENRWKIYHATPYRETLVLDTDMLCLSNVDNIWPLVKHDFLKFTNNIYNYKNEVIQSDYYRKTFTANSLPNTYCGVFYFKKSDQAKSFFTLAEMITKNWAVFYKKYTPKNTQKWNSMDVNFSLSAKLLDINLNSSSILSFTHMKPMIQGWSNPPDKWTNYLSTEFDKDLIVGGFKQRGIFHYVEQEFLSEDVVKKLEENL